MWIRVLAVATAALAVVLPVRDVAACGGLFCASIPADSPVPPEPVDQTAERIVFTVDAETVTAHVQISYVGPADDFAWIVPVPDTPEVEESEPDMFRDVDRATALDVVLPPPELCPSPVSGGGGSTGCIGCSANDAASGGLTSDVGADSGVDGESPVTVYASDVTDNYEFSVIGAAEAADLIAWLQANDFNVSENMIPVMQPYIDEGMRYLAVKMRDGRSASDIQPLAITYPGDEPMIPIRLTAVAAQPLMGIQVWIFGAAPYVPTNYTWMEPADQFILSDANGDTSYFAWVARTVDEYMGRLMIGEFIGQNQTGRFPQHPVVSRFYTRLSPEQMTVDPVFAVDATGPVVDNVLDLSWQRTPFLCSGLDSSALPSECAFHYCGEDAQCAVEAGRVGCVCPPDRVATALTGPDGARTVTCVPADNPFGITAEAGGAGGEFDPCNDVDCGAGECVLRNGFPTCACDDGTLACLEPDGSVACVVAPSPITFGPGGGVESAASPTASRTDFESNRRDFGFGFAVPPVLLLAFFAAARRRRSPWS